MDRFAYVASLRTNGRAMVDFAQGRLDQPVPPCPDWSMADLIWHTGMVHTRWCAISEGLVPDKNSFSDMQRPGDSSLLGWFSLSLEALSNSLERADPASPAWTWSNDKTVGFIQRRMAQETAIHAFDAASAAGQARTIDAELARDGIDELLDIFLLRRPDRLEGPPVSVHLHCTDGDGEWIVHSGEGNLSVDRTHAKGDAAVRASASDLLLLLWHRIGADNLEIHGDKAMLDAFLDRTAGI